MPRVTHLPPLTRTAGMQFPVARFPKEARERRPSLVTSDAQLSKTPIDCVLVYDPKVRAEDADDAAEKVHSTSAVQRKKFEEYLCKNQSIELERVESGGLGYVKVHTPSKVLLKTAENIRMRLPIEKVESGKDALEAVHNTRWKRFRETLKKPFRLAESLSKDEPDYYTAIYSSNVPQFQTLMSEFERENLPYFTPADRSFLTYELLVRAHSQEPRPEDGLEQKPDTFAGLNIAGIGRQRGETRPGKYIDSRFVIGCIVGFGFTAGIDRLVSKKIYLRYFPLHEPLREGKNRPDAELNDREKLQRHWATMFKCFKFQPLSLVRSYLGEKLAFYFALCGFYNKMLILPSIIGLIVFIYGAATVAGDEPTSAICGDYGLSTDMCPRCDKTCPFWKLSDSCVYSKISYVFDNAATLVFAVLMSLWARWFVEMWKRRQAVLRYEWDSMDFDAHLEPIRPAFERYASRTRQERVNPVTEAVEPYVPLSQRIPFFILSAAVVIITMLIVCGTIFGTIVYRVQMDYVLKDTSAKAFSSIIITVTSAVINLICTLILSKLYYWLAAKITDLERHKYQSKYEDSLIAKIYLFQFVNFYSSLFYIAFFKGRFLEYPSKYSASRVADFTEQCDPAGCLVELSIQFFVIMIGNQIINNIVEICLAMRRTFFDSLFTKNNGRQQWEIDNTLDDLTTEVLIDEYLELVIQFGFVTLFVVAFPLAPLFALINNLIELRLDAWKFLSKHKRPIPFKASDIGIWSDILSAISYLAVLTNAIVIAWTSEFIPKMAYRILRSSSSSLSGYVDWTLSSFPISDYNSTGLMPPGEPPGLTACRYRDFRESTGPSYSPTTVYWNVVAGRLAFIIVFEHLIFFIIYLIQWIIADVPKHIRDKIDHERFIDQRERWASTADRDVTKEMAATSYATVKLAKSIPESAPVADTTDERMFKPRTIVHRTGGFKIMPMDKP